MTYDVDVSLLLSISNKQEEHLEAAAAATFVSFQNEDELVKAKVLMSFFRLIEQELKRPKNSKTLFEKLWLEPILKPILKF